MQRRPPGELYEGVGLMLIVERIFLDILYSCNSCVVGAYYGHVYSNLKILKMLKLLNVFLKLKKINDFPLGVPFRCTQGPW